MIERARFYCGTCILVIAGAIALAACTGRTGPRENPVDIGIEDAVARWNAHALRDYGFEFQWKCYCARPLGWWRLDVARGVVSDVQALEGQAFEARTSDFETIDGLLGIIENAAEQNAHAIVASYDSVYGYPVSVDIDYVEMAVDEELGFEIRRFEAK